MRTTFRNLRKQFIEEIKMKYHPKYVYYPACGADTLPKETFGTHHVIHLSLPEEPNELSYFTLLGDGIKLVGDMDQSPLADASVDLIWLKLEGIELSDHAINDFNRVLKKGGHVAIEDYHAYDRNRWNGLLMKFGSFNQIDLKNDKKTLFGVYKHKDYLRQDEYQRAVRIMNSEPEMIDYVVSHKDYSGVELIVDRALFQKE